MKSEELLNSLDHVGEDLIAEAEQNILVRTKRPWLKTAVAAVLVAAIGVGGWLTLKNITMRSSTPATEPSATSVTEPVRPVETLPKLELGNSWDKLQGRMTVVSGNLNLCPDGITSLPVYRDLSADESSSNFSYSEEQMRTILDEAVQRLGASPLGEVETEWFGGGLFYLTRNTDKGILSVSYNGDVFLNLDGRFDIAPERADSSEDLVLSNGSPFSNDILSCVRRDQELLGLPEDLLVVYQEYSSVLIFPARSDPAEQLVVRSFGAVCQNMGSEHSSMNYLNWNQRPGSAGWFETNPERLELLGWYPTITLAEAKQMALEGKGFCIEDTDLNLTEDRITGMELVYSDVGNEMQIPYYRFWFSRSFEALYGGNDDFCVCIPAIQPEFLSDWQPDSEVRIPVDAPFFTTRVDMYYYVSGYAGEVEALQFPGYEPEFAVTADVDGDGNEELVYLYTDGTHFVGIAAYGLDEGRPVLKGSKLFIPNGRYVRLDYDPDSGVWFSLSGNTEEDRSSTAIRARLSVEDGSIVLSEALPDECLIRADASFVKIACGDSYYANEGKCYFTNGTTMVWDLYGNGVIQKRNMLTGEKETLFELPFDEDSYTTLIGVTDERLYFCEYTQNGSTTYSVNYRNEDRRVEDRFAEHDQLVLRRTEDMRWEVWGHSGFVEALQYMGIPEQIEKYAELDGDGKNELLYLFTGPTSGLHTEGIAVYGADDGMPVLRASVILNLNGYDLRLDVDETTGIPSLLFDPIFPSPEGTEPVQLNFGMENGSIRFYGTLPEGCEIWGEQPDADSEQDDEALKAELSPLFSDPRSWYARALSSCFAYPEDVDLYLFFYAGLQPDEECTGEEAVTVWRDLYGFELNENGEYAGPPIDRLPRAEMDQVLRQYFGLGLEQSEKRGLQRFKYSADTDCYYHCHGDTNEQPYEIKAARRLANGAILCTYDNTFWNGITDGIVPAARTVALWPTGNGEYQILSNLPGEWITGVDVSGMSSLYCLSGTKRAETQNDDGSVTIRELDFDLNGELHYRELNSDSEVTYRAWGIWWLDNDYSIHIALCETDENGNRTSPWQATDYRCRLTGDELVLFQQSETGFSDDVPGAEIAFRLDD